MSHVPQYTVQLLLICLAGMLATGPAGAGPASDLETALAGLDGECASGARDRGELELDYLRLIDPSLPPEVKGMVYARIATMYTMAEQKAPERAAAYCQEALSYPLPAASAAQMHVYWADALILVYGDWDGLRFPVARRRILEPCLAGLAIALDHGAQAGYAEPPPVGKHDIAPDPNNPASQAVEARHAAELAARQDVVERNELSLVRATLISTCKALYAREPADYGELSTLAGRALAGHPDVVAELMADAR